MKRSAEAPPPAVSLLGGTLALWLLVPCIVAVFSLGIALLTEGVTKARDTNEHLAEALCRYIDIFISDAHANLVSLARLDGRTDPGELLAAIRQTQESLTRFQRILLVDEDGIVRFTHPAGFVGVDFPALFPAGSESAISRPVYSAETGSLTVFMRARTDSGAMIAGELNLDALLEHLQHFSQGLHGTLVAVTDGFGNLVAHPDMTLVRRQANIGDWRIFGKASGTGTFSALGFRDGSLVSDTIARLPGHQWRVILSTSLWDTLSDTLKIVATIEALLVAYFFILFLSVRRTLTQRIIRPIVGFSKSMADRAVLKQYDPTAPAPFLELGIIEREFGKAIATIRESEERLRTSQAILEQAQSIGRMGSWQLDLVENRLTWSDEVYRIFGATREDFAPSYESFLAVVHPDDRAAVGKAYSSSLEENRQSYEIEHRIVRMNDGETRFVIERCLHERNPAGRAVRSVGMVQDITERKNTERALARAKESAETASRAKSEFLANMSHEIRTPLNGVMSILQLLETSAENPEQRQHCRLALQSANRLNRLLADILDLSRVEAGKLRIHAEPFNLRETIAQMLDLFGPASVQSGVELRHHVDPRVPDTLVGDPIRLQQVLGNLVGNAFKFTSRGHIDVEVYPLPAKTPDRTRLFFSVSDSGCGICERDLENLFSPFTQLSQGYTKSHQGAGLGLSICRQLVTLMDGTMAVESEVGVGTTFGFCVTVGRAKAIPAAARTHKTGSTCPAGRRVLLADDDEISMFSVHKLLEKAGYGVVVARDGREVLEMLEAEDFDVILMDIQMPSLNGVDATRLIRQNERLGPRRCIPIIAMTAYAMEGDRETFLNAGMNGYLAKPIAYDALLETLALTLPEKPASTGQ